ncbi:MAG: MerR family DNA-binding protein [Firmicutes bacterium]|nr:MerR family DNA-binding protein [Bacillota bacterium]
MEGLTISQVASSAQVNIETVRYYERRGLIPEPPRRKSEFGFSSHPGYRQYPFETVRRIQFIRRARALGFTLKEIKQLLAIADGKKSGCRDVFKFTTKKIADVEDKIDQLKQMRKMLKDLAKRCTGKGPLSECPVIESLTDGIEDNMPGG